MSTAQDTVISMPEPLELIALLPMRPLLFVAPLVSKTWQAITLTPDPQRTLFLQPDRGSEPIQNTLLVATFPPFFASEPADEHEMRMPWAAKAEDASKRNDAGWRRTQPPAQTMTVIETCRVGTSRRPSGERC